MKIAVKGCMHGDLDIVYQTIQHLEKLHDTKIDLLLCCGDFQEIRNEKDMQSLNVPPKYKEMKSFGKYYSGQEVAPVPTIFIGGNHEASNYLWELYYGGWTAPNIFFLGFAGVVKFGNLRIGGLSGIYNARDYHRETTLMQVAELIDSFLSHDWPLGITDCGDWKQLVRFKPYFEKEADNDPIAPAWGILREDIRENPNCLVFVTLKGGHLGWVVSAEALFGKHSSSKCHLHSNWEAGDVASWSWKTHSTPASLVKRQRSSNDEEERSP